MMFASFLYAHSGGTDSNGCHTNSKTGEYHCH
ncbi:YHYH domain-containing protein [Campylobacter hyointestinalis]